MESVARRKFPAKLDSLSNSLEFVSACAQVKGFSARRISEIQLAAEEALVNIFRYAYPEGPGEVEVICRSDARQRLVIELVDRGTPFDVLSVPEPNLKSDPDLLAENGATMERLAVAESLFTERRDEPGALILRSVATHERRALYCLVVNPLPGRSVEEFAQSLCADPLSYGFSGGVAQLTSEEWSALYQFVERLKADLGREGRGRG